jgi:hypothetical protein
MGWLIALGIVVALSLLPLGLSLRYDASGLQMFALAGLIRIPMNGKREEKETKTSPKQKKKRKKKQKTQKTEKKLQKKKTGGSLADFLPFVQIALDLLDDFRRKIRVRRLEMKLVMAADDPCDLAINYGRAWAALGNLMPQLERCFAIKKRDLEVECDFEASKTLITARMDVTITLGRLLRILFRHGLRAVKQYFMMKKSKKGGAPNE